MTPFIKSLLRLIFVCAVNIGLGILAYLLVVWAAGFFAVPFGIVQIIGFLIFCYVAYRVVMAIVAFMEANPIQ